VDSTYSSLKKIFVYFFFGLILIGTYLMLRIIIPYTTFAYDVDFLLTKQAILHVDIWRWAFYIHISSSLLILLLGMFQFFPLIFKNYPSLHRLIGKTYIILTLTMGAPTGLIMGYYANGGWFSKASFIILSLSWWIFTYIAYLKIKRREIKLHIAFMYRSYALTLSALTFRLYVFIFPYHFLDFSAKEMYALIAWLSWVPNLIVAECLLRINNKNLNFLQIQ
jgi:hypothetical protein